MRAAEHVGLQATVHRVATLATPRCEQRARRAHESLPLGARPRQTEAGAQHAYARGKEAGVPRLDCLSRVSRGCTVAYLGGLGCALGRVGTPLALWDDAGRPGGAL